MYLSDLGELNLTVTLWAYLKPNLPTSDSIICYSCQNTFKVQRINCTNEGCKGNVIGENDVCLTCLEEIEND